MMTTVARPWFRRAPEEAYLFNPAFIGSLVHEYAKEHMRQRQEGAPLTFVLIALAVVLHGPTRRRLPSSTLTSLFAWIQDNEDLVIGLPSRLGGLRPYAMEGVSFSLSADALRITDGHSFGIGSRRAMFGAAFLRETTAETREVIERTKFAARWFAKSGSEATVIAAWGVRP